MPLSSDPVKRARQLANLRPAPPPPPEGNVRNLRHGGTARKATLAAAGSWAERIMAELEREAPLRDADGGLPVHDRQVVELLASALARLQSVSAWLDLHGPLDEKGRPRPAVEVERRLRGEASRYLDALGMTPKARAALGVDLARQASSAAEAEAARAARQRFEARAAGLEVIDSEAVGGDG